MSEEDIAKTEQEPQAPAEEKDSYVGPDGKTYLRAPVAAEKAREFAMNMLKKAREEKAKAEAKDPAEEVPAELPDDKPKPRNVVLDRDVEVYVYASGVDAWNDKPKFGPARFNRNLYKLAEGLENIGKQHPNCFVRVWNVENPQLSDELQKGQGRYRARALPKVLDLIPREQPVAKDIYELYAGEHPTLPDDVYPTELAKNVCLQLVIPDEQFVIRIRALCAEASVRGNLDCATFTAVFGGKAVGFNYATDSKSIAPDSLVQLFEASRAYSGMMHDTIKSANPDIVFPSDERRAEELRLIQAGKDAIAGKLVKKDPEIVLPGSVAGSTVGKDGVARPPEPTTIVSLN